MNKMFVFTVFLSIFASLPALSGQKPIKVAVLDTGFDMSYRFFANLCPGEHKDFTGTGLNDTYDHGTNVTGVIVGHAGKSTEYCIVIIKVYDNKSEQKYTEGLRYAYTIGADIINISGGGPDQIIFEKLIINKILDKGITVIAAAGNERKDLDQSCNYYPACYDHRIIVVGADAYYSNKGRIVDIIESGERMLGFGRLMRGTSQATAVVTGKMIKLLVSRRNKK